MNSLKPTVMRGVVSIPLVIVMPPLGVLLARGLSVHFYLCLGIFAAAICVFVFLYAGVGVLLYMTAMLYGLLLALWTIVRAMRA
jgi:hypothetical protein